VDGEQDALARLGIDLVNRLFVLVRTGLLFDLNNDAMQRPVAAALETLEGLRAHMERRAALCINGDNIALNRQLLRPDPATYKNARFLERIYRRLGAQDLVFGTDCNEPRLRTWLATLRSVVEGKVDPAAMRRLSGVELVPLADADACQEQIEIDRRIQVLRTFAGAVATMANVMDLVQRRQPFSPSIVRRVAYDLSDAAAREPDLLLGLLHLPIAERPLPAHLVRTAILAFLCAERVGLDRRARAEAAMVALSHHFVRPLEADYDSGPELEQGAGARTDPLEAALSLCSRAGLNEGLIRRVVGVYEATGAMCGRDDLYSLSRPGDLLGRIAFLADRYTTLLDALRPDEALRVLLLECQEREPDLVLVFVTVVGLYPVGTVVKLESGALATVTRGPRHHRHLLAPVVRLNDDPGAPPVDLSRAGHGHGGVARPVRPAERLNVSHLFLL
jgi:hypothetical protein